MFRRISSYGIGMAALLIGGVSCKGSHSQSANSTAQQLPWYCTQQTPDAPITGTVGTGLTFDLDPMVSSKNQTLAPTSVNLGSYAASTPLEHLTGRGLLSGAYVDVVNGTCGGQHGAFDSSNQFNFPYGDPRFPEVMGYAYGDRFRAALDDANVLLPAHPVRVIATCNVKDNAYYSQALDSANNLVDFICLGTSSRVKGANFADDGEVTMHELEHATTTHAYSTTTDLNRLSYDEAGGINEGISDFMSLIFSEPLLPAGFDPKVFSRWALGSFFSRPSFRGAHRCPTYDPSFPNCDSFRTDTSGFSGAQNHISFAYPDGMGWPYATTDSGPGIVKNEFLNFTAQEEIHNTATIASGTLFEIYEGLKSSHAGDPVAARKLASKLMVEAMMRLPKPTDANPEPVNYRTFGAALSTATVTLGFSADDQAAIGRTLTERGLIGAPNLESGWAGVGPGSSVNAGIRYIDVQPANGIRDEKFKPGDKGAVWFDLKNLSALTAGGISLDVTIVGSGIRFLDGNYNYGYQSDSHANIYYGKVNGSAVVAALAASDPNYSVPTDTTYFRTNPNYDVYGTTTLWVEVLPTATPGPITFHVTATPANGPPATLDFPAKIGP